MRVTRVAAALCSAAVIALAGLPSAWAEPSPDPNLAQTVAPNESDASGKTELDTGHVDIGPRLTPEGWRFLARDDTKTPPVWRDPSEIVVRVHDKAALQLPDDPQYEFLGIGSGETAYVIPQTQNPDVVWLGWNTQDPKVTKAVERGATLVFHRYQGPGSFHVFLQNGFDKPLPLWDGKGADGQEIWVDVNTHTHANWVFSKPGVYLVDMSIKAKGRDGTEFASRGTLRFAVGDKVATTDAFAAAFAEPASATPNGSASPTAMPGTSPEPGAEAESGPSWVVIAVAGGLAVVALGAGVAVLRARRIRREVMESDHA